MSAGIFSALLTLAAAPADVQTDAPTGSGGKMIYFLVFLGIMIIMVVMMRLRVRAMKSAGRRLTSAPPPGAGGGARETFERLSVDLEETARSVSALLDTKIRVLDQLIRDADERIARMEKLAGPYSTPEPPPIPPIPTGGPRDETLEHHARIYGLADRGLSVQQIAEETGFQRGEVELILSLRKLARPPDHDRT